MSNQIYDEYYIDMSFENVINLSSNISDNLTPQSTEDIITNTSTNPNISLLTESAPSNPLYNNNIWRPNETFLCIYNKFQSTILKEYPDTPCVYCGRLLYKNKATWITYNPDETYLIEQNNQVNVLITYGTVLLKFLHAPLVQSHKVGFLFQY